MSARPVRESELYEVDLSFAIVLKDFSVSICGVKLWNELGDQIRGCPSMRIFRRLYKDMIFELYRTEDI